MDDKDSQNVNSEPSSPIPYMVHEKVLQPSASSVEEVKAAQAESVKSQVTPQNTQETVSQTSTDNAPQPLKSVSTLYPEATKGIGTPRSESASISAGTDASSSKTGNADKQRSNYSVKGTGYKPLMFVGIVVLIGIFSLLLMRSNIATILHPGKDVVTPISDFRQYTYKNDAGKVASLMFYKDSKFIVPSQLALGGLLSPSLSDDRLPLTFSLSEGGKLTSSIQPKCIINSHGNGFVFAVYVKSIGANVNVCDVEKIQGGGAYAYNVEFSSKQHSYLAHFSIDDTEGLTGGYRYNLARYSTDIKTILSSIQPVN